MIYRTNPNKIQLKSNPAPKLRTLYRKFLILLNGKFKKRFPDKCNICNKRSYGIYYDSREHNRYTSYGSLNYLKCGHKRSGWRVWEMS